MADDTSPQFPPEAEQTMAAISAAKQRKVDACHAFEQALREIESQGVSTERIRGAFNTVAEAEMTLFQTVMESA